MKILRSVTVIAVVAAMLAPSAALAQAYPRHVTIDGMDCIQQPGRDGIETWCQIGEDPPFRVNPMTGARMDPPPLRLTKFEHSNPIVAATNLASQNDRSGRYFAGGFGLGVLLGPLGWVIAGLNASNSPVEIPAPASHWTHHHQTQFAMTYSSEVRSSRTTAAILGGVTGTAALTTVVLLAIAASN